MQSQFICFSHCTSLISSSAARTGRDTSIWLGEIPTPTCFPTLRCISTLVLCQLFALAALGGWRGCGMARIVVDSVLCWVEDEPGIDCQFKLASQMQGEKGVV